MPAGRRCRLPESRNESPARKPELYAATAASACFLVNRGGGHSALGHGGLSEPDWVRLPAPPRTAMPVCGGHRVAHRITHTRPPYSRRSAANRRTLVSSYCVFE